MLLNYLKIAVRSFTRQKYYSIINTVGLALGAAACILILLFVKDELSYEHSFQNHGNIYRLTEDFPMGTHLSRSATVPFPVKNRSEERRVGKECRDGLASAHDKGTIRLTSRRRG